jgi:hypothetical protein
MENLTLITYTHNKASDIHEPYFNRVEKYFNIDKHIVLCNVNLSYPGLKMSIYNDDNDKYYEQMIDALKMVDTDYIIYSQEDYILFDYVNKFKIKNLINVLENDNEISFIRLINSGINFKKVDYNDELFYLDKNNDYYFSTQITLWKTKDLIEMFETSKVETIWDEPLNSKFLMELGKVGLCVKEKGDKVGGHYNSSIYPYIATAIVKGKWNYSEYKKDLDLIFNEFNIDKEKRGIR